MENIKDIVKNIIQDIEQKKAHQQKDFQQVWRSCIKEEEAKHTRAEGIKEKTLYVSVDCSVWMFQCRLRYKNILEKIQKELPEIKRIYFKVGKVK
ncbi:MAG: DUF721 domain-containing protein [Candidatus Omnitrophota bacterium]